MPLIILNPVVVAVPMTYAVAPTLYAVQTTLMHPVGNAVGKGMNVPGAEPTADATPPCVMNPLGAFAQPAGKLCVPTAKFSDAETAAD